MDITEVKNTKELPACELRCYTTSDGEALESASAKFAAIYGHPPVRGWAWGHYIYFELGGLTT